jgi:hypothetical protein
MITKQFTLYLQNKPGVLARVTTLLTRGGINIEGISASAGADIGLVQIVTANADKTRRLLKKSGIPFVEGDVVVTALKNVPGALARVVSEIARRKININYVYATACESCRGCGCYAVISAPDLKKVEAVCKACRA